jgi:hypothetical protein
MLQLGVVHMAGSGAGQSTKRYLCFQQKFVEAKGGRTDQKKQHMLEICFKFLIVHNSQNITRTARKLPLSANTEKKTIRQPVSCRYPPTQKYASGRQFLCASPKTEEEKTESWKVKQFANL